MKQTILILFITVVFTSCDESGITPAECNKLWSLISFSGSTYNITGGYLHVNTSVSQPETAFILQLDTLIQGEFSISVSFDNFSSGTGLGGFFELHAYSPSGAPNNYAKVFIGTVTPNGNGLQLGAASDSAGTDPMGNSGNYTFTSSTSGNLTIERNVSTLSLRAAAGNDIVISNSVFPSNELIFSLRTGSNFQPVTGLSVRVNGVLYGAGSIQKTDNFDCNSID